MTRRLVQTALSVRGNVEVHLLDTMWAREAPMYRPKDDPSGVLKAALGYREQPTRANREGDSQPMPTRNDHEDIQSMVIDDIGARRLIGIRRYGTALQPNNGRDALVDLYEELLDACMYIKQAIVERDLAVPAINRVTERILADIAKERQRRTPPVAVRDPWPEGPMSEVEYGH